MDTIATNPNQADDPVGDPAEAAIEALLISVDDAQSARPDGLRGQHHDDTDADGIADGGVLALGGEFVDPALVEREVFKTGFIVQRPIAAIDKCCVWDGFVVAVKGIDFQVIFRSQTIQQFQPAVFQRRLDYIQPRLSMWIGRGRR